MSNGGIAFVLVLAENVHFRISRVLRQGAGHSGFRSSLYLAAATEPSRRASIAASRWRVERVIDRPALAQGEVSSTCTRAMISVASRGPTATILRPPLGGPQPERPRRSS